MSWSASRDWLITGGAPATQHRNEYVQDMDPYFWDTVGEHINACVKEAMSLPQRHRMPIIIYLRDLEGIARRQCDSRQMIQIIASGRHLLGDRADVAPSDGPFSRT